MAINIAMHTSKVDPLSVSSDTQFTDLRAPFVTVDIGVGESKVTLFLKTMEEVERLAFEFSTLAETLRSDCGWKVSNADA